MKKRSSVSLGPGAASLILIFVVLALAALGMLSLMTSRNDLSLSVRSARVTEAVYRLQATAEERRAELDALLQRCAGETDTEEEYLEAVEASLPEEVLLEDGQLVWQETDGSRVLDCVLTLLPRGAEQRSEWTCYQLTAETEDTWNW